MKTISQHLIIAMTTAVMMLSCSGNLRDLHTTAIFTKPDGHQSEARAPNNIVIQDGPFAYPLHVEIKVYAIEHEKAEAWSFSEPREIGLQTKSMAVKNLTPTVCTITQNPTCESAHCIFYISIAHDGLCVCRYAADTEKGKLDGCFYYGQFDTTNPSNGKIESWERLHSKAKRICGN